MECKKSENMNMCNCTYTCDKKGMCCECVAYHRKRGELSACYFTEAQEKTYDRTIEYFIQVNTR